MNINNIYYFSRKPQKNKLPFYPELTVLSNFEDKHPIKLDNGLIALTAEHYFQAYKHINNKLLYNKILQVRTKTGKISPNNARKLGKGSSKTGVGRLSQDEIIVWNKNRSNIMYKILIAKFTQHNDLKNILLNTGNSILIENAPWDSYWGIGKNGNGENMLGKILMKVRDEIKYIK